MRPWHRRLLVGVAAAIAACSSTPQHAPQAQMPYLALGDSYTIGEGVDADARWPGLLAAALRADGVALAEPRIIAATGWTTGELAAAIDAEDPPHDFALVTLLAGVNNQYRGRGVDEYGREFEALLRRGIGFAGGRADRVLVLSIPDWGATRFGQASGRDLAGVARELDAYNATARALCARHGVAFVDITATSRALGLQPGMLAADGLHPSAAMHAEWARLALPVARALLARP